MNRKLFFRIVPFVLLATLCAGSFHPARAAEDLKTWHFYADATVRPQADDSYQAVYADFTRLLTRDLKQEGAELDVNSIRVAPLEEGKAGAVVPSRFVTGDGFDAAKRATGTVVFLVAGTKEPGAQQYRIFFDTLANGPKAEVKSETEVPDAANLVWNGGFEILSEGYTGPNRYKNAGANMPAGWWGNLKNRDITENTATEAHSGQHALALPVPPEGKNIGIGATPSPPALRVVPGQNYIFSAWVHGAGLTPSRTAVVASIYWYGKDGEYLQRVRVTDVPVNLADFPWTKIEISLPAPADVHFGAMRLSTYSPTGKLTLDDLEARLAVPPGLRGAKTNQ